MKCSKKNKTGELFKKINSIVLVPQKQTYLKAGILIDNNNKSSCNLYEKMIEFRDGLGISKKLIKHYFTDDFDKSDCIDTFTHPDKSFTISTVGEHKLSYSNYPAWFCRYKSDNNSNIGPFHIMIHRNDLNTMRSLLRRAGFKGKKNATYKNSSHVLELEKGDLFCEVYFYTPLVNDIYSDVSKCTEIKLEKLKICYKVIIFSCKNNQK